MISLFCYSEYSNESIDEIIDSYLQDLIIAYFKHEHIPRGLFHTDKTYINEVLMKESYIEDKVQSDISTMIFINNMEGNKTEFNEIEALTYESCGHTFDAEHLYMGNLDILDEIPPNKKDRYLRRQENLISNFKTLYKLRAIYPNESFSEKQKNAYKLEMFLYNRVLFNELTRHEKDSINTNMYYTPKNTGKKIPEYLEPEYFLKEFKNNIISIDTPLKKGVYMALYLALKEIELDNLQSLFPKIKTETENKYYKITLDSINKFIDNNDYVCNNATTPSKTDVIFLKSLIFVCMWEKSYYHRILKQDMEHMHRQDMKRRSDYISSTDFNKLFKETPIENIDEVLKEATKLLEMSESVLDFSKFKSDDNLIYSEDMTLTLYNLSRTEREIIPNIINIINLLRERQKNILLIENGNSFKKENQNKLKYIDIGFNIPHFKRKLPELKNIKSLQWADWNGRLIVTPVTCKFICETDRILSEKGEIDYIANNKKAINTTYLYKIRNQATHYSSDESIGHLLKPKNIRQLIIILLHAYEKYNTVEKEKCKSLINKVHPEDISKLTVLPKYVVSRITKLIQVLSMLLLTINKDKFSSKEKKSFPVHAR